MKKGLFITFEGIDGSGKSTQLRFICEKLDEMGVPYVRTREPGGGDIAEAIRALVLDPQYEAMTPRAEALLYAAARAQHVHEVIRPGLARGELILCDRFLDSSIAYQAYGRELGEEGVRAINAFALEGLQPDATFYFAVTQEDARERSSSRESFDRMERAGEAFDRRVAKGFEHLAAQEPERIIRIDAKGTKYETHDITMVRLLPLLRQAGMLP